MLRIHERNKIDIALVGQSLANTNATGRYFDMAHADLACAILTAGAIAATKTAKIELLQAKDAAGTGAKAITNASATIAANTLVTKATITVATLIATDAVTINGLTFTGIANGGTPAGRQFAVGAGGAADTDSATALAAIINDATYGVPGVVATAAAAVVTLVATNGDTAITVSTDDSTITLATVEAQAFVEIAASALDVNNGFTHVAAKVTTTGTTICTATLIRSVNRYGATQAVGASASV